METQRRIPTRGRRPRRLAAKETQMRKPRPGRPRAPGCDPGVGVRAPPAEVALSPCSRRLLPSARSGELLRVSLRAFWNEFLNVCLNSIFYCIYFNFCLHTTLIFIQLRIFTHIIRTKIISTAPWAVSHTFPTSSPGSDWRVCSPWYRLVSTGRHINVTLTVYAPRSWLLSSKVIHLRSLVCINNLFLFIVK